MRRVAFQWSVALVMAPMIAILGLLAHDFGSFLEGALVVGFTAGLIVVSAERARRRCEWYRQALLLDNAVPGLQKHLADCPSCEDLAVRLEEVNRVAIRRPAGDEERGTTGP